MNIGWMLKMLNSTKYGYVAFGLDRDTYNSLLVLPEYDEFVMWHHCQPHPVPAIPDPNLRHEAAQEIFDAGLDFYSNDGHWVFSLYGRNLANDVKHGGDTQLPEALGPVPLGGTFSPLAKGRVYGTEVTYNF